jgi:hypothetical protein
LQTIALQLLEKLIKIHIPGCIPELWSWNLVNGTYKSEFLTNSSSNNADPHQILESIIYMQKQTG